MLTSSGAARDVRTRSRRRVLVAVLGAVALLIVIAGGVVVLPRWLAQPAPTYRFVEEFNAAALAVPEGERAIRGYREALLKLPGISALPWDARPGDTGWNEAVT